MSIAGAHRLGDGHGREGSAGPGGGAVFAVSAGQGAGTARVSGAVGSQVAVGHVPGCHIPAPAAQRPRIPAAASARRSAWR
jgi:hypothetical protein